MKRLALLIPVLLPSLVLADPLHICPGTYAASWGNATLSAAGDVMIAGTPGSASAVIEVTGCDTARFSAEGQGMDLTRTGDASFQGVFADADATRVFDFTFISPTSGTAAMVGQGGGLTVTRGMALQLQTAAGTAPESCFVDGPPPPDSLEQIAAERWMFATGLRPVAGRPATDYVDIRRSPDRRDITFDLTAEGAILPRPTRYESHQAFCDPGARLDAPRKLLSFKIFDVAPGVTVFARIIDIETGRIEAQAEGVANGTGAEAISLAMGEAYIGMGRLVGPVLADPVSR